MAWIVTLAFFGFIYWRVRKARERAAEHAATGMLRSPLYWTQALLLCVLLGLVFSAPHVQDKSVAYGWLGAVGLTLVSLFFVRRALKWRYPI
jgi:protein-S-isoprenylcysteine O-methyltransferase Ste14